MNVNASSEGFVAGTQDGMGVAEQVSASEQISEALAINKEERTDSASQEEEANAEPAKKASKKKIIKSANSGATRSQNGAHGGADDRSQRNTTISAQHVLQQEIMHMDASGHRDGRQIDSQQTISLASNRSKKANKRKIEVEKTDPEQESQISVMEECMAQESRNPVAPIDVGPSFPICFC